MFFCKNKNLCNVLGLNACFLTWFGNIGYTLSLVSYELLFPVWAHLCVQICMLELGFIFCVAPLIHHIFRKKSPTFVSCGALFYFTEYIIWHCLLLCSCQCFNCLFHFNSFFFVFDFVLAHTYFSRRKTSKDLVLFMKTKTFNVCIKTVP